MMRKFFLLMVTVAMLALGAPAIHAGELTEFRWINLVGNGVSGPESSVFRCDGEPHTWSWMPPASYTAGGSVYIRGFEIDNGDVMGMRADISAGIWISDGRAIGELGEDHYAERTGGTSSMGHRPTFFGGDYMTLRQGQSIQMVATCGDFYNMGHSALFQFAIYLVKVKPLG
jgi:hypothetical protein